MSAERGLNHPHTGATEGDLPAGYHHVKMDARLGAGRAAFDAAGEALMTWRMHVDAGVRVRSAPERAVLGADVELAFGGLRFACRVVSVVQEPDVTGFTYGTLEGHPEQGEERFLVRHDPATGAVTGEVVAFSRPGTVLARLLGPAGRVVQRLVTRRYLRALTRAARAAS